jgi:hypothetical protein
MATNEIVLSPPLTEPKKPWSVADFEKHRAHSVQFVKREILPLLERRCRRIIIRAPVKSGKRELAEYIAMRDKQDEPTRRVHIFASAWHRTADESQRDELKHHNMYLFSINNMKNANACIRFIHEKVAEGKQIVLHLDECDHGSGETQILGRIWRTFRDNSNITNILYSATPEEVLFSGEVDRDADYEDMVETMLEDGHVVNYEPPEGYCGPAEFIRQNLVFEAHPFFIQTTTGLALSEQGRTIVSDFLASIKVNPRRNIVVLRLSYFMGPCTKGDRKGNKAIYMFLKHLASFPELSGFLIMADKGEKFGRIGDFLKENIQWSEDSYWASKVTGRPILMVIDQTSVRSTEWRCHDRIFATHDYRPTVTFSVASQAQERVNHYKQRYGGEFQPIRVYGHTKTWLLSAGMIDYREYSKNMWVKRKVDRRRTGDDIELYRILDSQTNEPHPTYNTEMSMADADERLLQLGCGSSVSISPRVTGEMKHLPEIEPLSFHACTKETFASIPELREFTNPFLASDREMEAHPDRWPRSGGQIGNLRVWGVYTYDYIERNKHNRMSLKSIQKDPKGRITICYKDGVLGVALRKGTGRTILVDKLTAYKSMYIPRTTD